MSIQNLTQPSNLTDKIYDIYCDNLYANNLNVSTSGSIISNNVYAKNYFSSNVSIVGPITAANTTLTAAQCLSNAILLYTGSATVKMPSAEDIIELIPNIQINSGFNINFINYSGDNIFIVNSDDGSFKTNGPTGIVIQQQQGVDSQETRTILCVISSLSPAVIDMY